MDDSEPQIQTNPYAKRLPANKGQFTNKSTTNNNNNTSNGDFSNINNNNNAQHFRQKPTSTAQLKSTSSNAVPIQRRPATNQMATQAHSNNQGANNPSRTQSNNINTNPVQASSTTYSVDNDSLLEEGWYFYFPDEIFHPPSLETTLEFVEGLQEALAPLKPGIRLIYQGDFQKIRSDPTLSLEWSALQTCLAPQMLEKLDSDAQFFLNCLGLCVFILVFEDEAQKSRSLRSQLGLDRIKITPRLYGYDHISNIRSIKSSAVGHFVSVQGTVVRTGTIKPLVTMMDFYCPKCTKTYPEYFKDGKWKSPEACATHGCKNKNMIPQRASAKTIDWQRIRIQEQLQDSLDPGRIPPTLEIEITGDLIDSCVPGDLITASGVIKLLPGDDNVPRAARQKSLFNRYLDCNSLEASKQASGSESEFTKDDEEAIQKIWNLKDKFKTIVNSIAPGIFGHEIVKAGIALTLFGGCRKAATRSGRMPIRGEPHLLIVGDPGLGKSQMLSSTTQIAPRGVYVCGSYSTSTGLTVTLVKESGSPDFALEAGALILGDLGICCIDEFDKMQSEHASLLEAMEQQSISIAKAGIVCTLPARTSVIAAANPVGGHYNRSKTVNENLKLQPALLSRFDLIFVLLDKPDELKDHMLSEHVMAVHGLKSRLDDSQASKAFSQSTLRGNTQGEINQLWEKLRVPNPASFDPIHPDLLRKYIAYAKRYCQPRLSPEACVVIQQFYLSLRAKHKNENTTPVTTRQLESLTRLAQARAKLELRNIVTADDAKDVIEIMKESLYDTYEDEHGNLDFSRKNGLSKAGKTKQFIAHLAHIADQSANNMFSYQQLYNMAQSMELKVPIFSDFLETLNLQGYLLHKPNNMYKLICK